MVQSPSRRMPAGASPEIPHSWSLSSWPASVWPNESARARWVLRSYRNELTAAGALSRSGKTLIVLGRGYARWLANRVAYVAEFESNNPAMRSTDAGSAAA
jgi:hypothetical protein